MTLYAWYLISLYVWGFVTACLHSAKDQAELNRSPNIETGLICGIIWPVYFIIIIGCVLIELLEYLYLKVYKHS